MDLLGPFRRLTPVQRRTFVACFLGWALDAFAHGKVAEADRCAADESP